MKTIKIVIHSNVCFLNGDTDDLLVRGLEKELSYDKKNKYFMQKAAVRRGILPGTKRYADVGTVKLFNIKHKMFNLGHLNKVKRLIEEYSEHIREDIQILIIEKRNPKILNYRLSAMPKELLGGIILRPYQQDAVDTWMKEGLGFIEISCGAGKTIITAEIIRRLDTRTLWMIDKKELLYQTKNEFEKLLGHKLGQVGDGVFDVKDITCATIQSVHKKLGTMKEWLNKVNLVIVSESHHAAAITYQKVFKELINTRYRLGETGTLKRDDGDSPILESLIGEVVYKLPAKQLENEGYLMKPKIIFCEVDCVADNYLSYNEAYEEYVVHNTNRNMKIINLVSNNANKKVLVLIGRIDHGVILNKLIKDSYFLHGSVPSKERNIMFNRFKRSEFNVLIGTQSIFSEGVDIPDLDIIINCAANRGDVRTVQTLGRVLRKSAEKKTATYMDFIDTQKYLKKASYARMKILKDEGHEVDLE